MKSARRQCFVLTAAIVTAHCIPMHRAPAQDAGTRSAAPAAAVDPFPAVYADPAVPLLQLPTKFHARRTSTNISVDKDHPVEVFNVEGAGCVRHQLDAFKQPAEDIVQQLSQATLPEKVRIGSTDYAVRNLTSKYGWLRLDNAFHQQRPAYPLTDHSVYVRTTLRSDAHRQATMRLGLDNWAVVYLNGRQVAMLDHAEAFETARIPISLRKGDNQLLIKTNNRVNRDVLAWALNCVLE